MNEYNHHRIIERLVLDPSIKKNFIEASDFTDFFVGFWGSKKIWEWDETAKQKYYFYLFYYDVTIKGKNTIKLNRITKNDYDLGIRMLKWNNSIRCMEKSGEKLRDGSYSLDGWDSNHDEKEFFSSVNDRKRSSKEAWGDKIGDTANQSDNVAFLHAMGAMDENKKDSRDLFEKHLKKCFSEYLFLEKEKEALFMLGIAFHGIMDSFTPSHMDFQKYSAQDMGLHAQGDVIPIMGFDKDGKLLDGNSSEQEVVCFDPGQFTKESHRNQIVDTYIKRFDGNDFVNPVEYKMLLIFFYISDIQVEYGNDWSGVGDIDEFWKTFEGCTLKQINDILGHGSYRYGPKSYVYSEAAIKVISDIYQILCDEREKCKSYAYYKKEKERIVETAINSWIDVYDGKEKIKINNYEKPFSIKDIREEHIKLSLYSKDSDMDEKYEKYKEWAAQQDIDRLNRLKG